MKIYDKREEKERKTKEERFARTVDEERIYKREKAKMKRTREEEKD